MNLLFTGRLGVIGGVLFSSLLFAQSQVSSACDPNRRVACEGDPVQSVPPLPKTVPGDLRVTFREGLLRIDAENCLLSVTLKTLAARMNAALEFPSGLVDERVFAHLGPAPAREVVGQLLNGTRLNYVISFSPLDPTRVTALRLTSSDPGNENTFTVAPVVVSESAGPELYGAAFTADSDNRSTLDPTPDEGSIEASSSSGIQRTQQNGVALSGEDLDRMQKAQIKKEQDCASRTDGVLPPGCAATKEDLQ